MVKRTKSWANACAEIEADPRLIGASNKVKREHLKGVAKHHAACIEQAFVAMSAEEKAYVIQGFIGLFSVILTGTSCVVHFSL